MKTKASTQPATPFARSSVSRLRTWLSPICILLCGSTLAHGSTAQVRWQGDSDLYTTNSTSAYKLTFAGGQSSSAGPPSCILAYGTPLMTTEVQLGVPSAATIEALRGTFCNAHAVFICDSSCVQVYVNGSPTREFGALGGTFYSFTVEVRPKKLLFTWDVPKVNGMYALPADGQSAAIPSADSPSGAVTWSIVGDNLGCSIDPTTGMVTAGRTPGTIRVQCADEVVCYEELLDLLPTSGPGDPPLPPDSCGDCQTGNCAGLGDETVRNGSVDIRIGMGWSLARNNARSLIVKQDVPTNTLATPTSLRYDFVRPWVDKVLNGSVLRQVYAPSGLANVLTNTAYKYTIEFYSPTNVLPKTNGFYPLTNTPFKTLTIENPGNDTNKLLLTDTLSSQSYEYTWLGDGWKLVSGAGLRTETVTVAWSQTNTVRTVTRTLQQGTNAPVFREIQVFQTNSYGERLIQRIIGSGPNALTNSYAYTADGYLEQAVHGDGTWSYYLYDDYLSGLARRPTNVFSGFLNQALTTNSTLCRLIVHDYSTNVVPNSGDDGSLAPTMPRRSIEYLLGQEIARSYNIALPGERRHIQCPTPSAAWTNSDNLVTVTKLFTNGFHHQETQSILQPDGTTTIYQYGPIGTNSLTNIVLSGHPDTTGTNVDSGTKTILIYNLLGQLLYRTNLDVASNFITSAEAYLYDNGSHVTNTTFLDGASTQQSYDCCLLQSTQDRDGTVTSFTYDALNRLLTTAKAGIVTSNVYDAAGNILSTVRFGGTGTNATAITLGSSTFDDAGRLTSSTDPLNNLTRYTNYVDGSGQNLRVTTNADLTTRIETYARDGSLMSITGTAVHGIRYEFGIQSDGGYQRRYTKQFKLNDDGTDTSEWAKTYTDGAGRAYKMEVPGASVPSLSYFNTQGQLWKQADLDGVTTLYQYNTRGELEYTALDLNTNGTIEFAGSDRIMQTVTDVTSNAALAAIVRRTRTYVWHTNGTNSSILVSSGETSVDGLHTWQTTYGGPAPLTNRTDVFFAGSGYRYETNTAPDGSFTASQYLYGRLASVTRKDSAGNQLAKTTYLYDAHGRQSQSIDARNGATTFGYNNADMVISVTTPAPGTGQNPQTTLSYYNNRLQATNLVAPDGAGTFYEFYPSGELKKTYGARTFPVAYSNDYAGRIKAMTNWTSFSTGAGARVTIWNYNSHRGWLDNKRYPDGTGPDYTYTGAGRLRSRIWARTNSLGQRITATYAYGFNDATSSNEHGDLVSITYTDPQITPSITNTYDRRGRLAVVTRNGVATTLTQNDAGQLTSESYSGGTLDGLWITNTYDQFSRRTNLSALSPLSALLSSSFAYDSASRLKMVTDGTNSATYSYLANSPLVGQIAFTNNGAQRMVTTKSYDFLNRLSSITNAPSGSSPLIFNYWHNDANQRIRVGLADGSFWIYEYDSLGQVRSGKRYWPDWTPVAGQQFEYAHDDIGNRISTKAGGDAGGQGLRSATYGANNLNQYTNRTVPGAADIIGVANATAGVKVNGQKPYHRVEYFRKELTINNASAPQWQSVTNLAEEGTVSNIVTGSIFLPVTPETFAHDLDGNLLSDGRWNYTWDAENRLLAMQGLSGLPNEANQRLDFEYDWRSRRISKTVAQWNGSSYVSQSTNHFLYDSWNLVGSPGTELEFAL